jgi:hypothetical protein
MAEGMTLPLLICKLTNKPVILCLTGSTRKIHESKRDLLTRIYIAL